MFNISDYIYSIYILYLYLYLSFPKMRSGEVQQLRSTGKNRDSRLHETRPRKQQITAKS